MILTGEKLDEMARAIWGKDWPSVLARRLKKSRQTLFNWRNRPTGHSKDTKRVLLAATEEQLVIISQYVQELREDVGN